MAFCPNCDAVIGAADRECPECGYDFPLTGEVHREGFAYSRRAPFAYSRIADLSLVVGAWAAGLGCAAMAILSVVELIRGNLCGALIVGPLVCFVLLGILVVFLRVREFEPRK